MSKKQRDQLIVALVVVVIGIVWLGYNHFHDEQTQQQQAQQTAAYVDCVAQQKAYYQPYLDAALYNYTNGGAQSSSQILQQEQAAIQECGKQY